MYAIPVVILTFLSIAALAESQQCDEPLSGDLHFIEDYSAPGFECKPDDLYCRAEPGRMVVFVCDASDYCAGKFYKNDTYTYPFGVPEEYTLHSTGNYRLVIHDAWKTHEGNYTCILTNGTHRISRNFYLYRVCAEADDEEFVPEAHHNEDTCVDKDVKLGEDNTLYCEFCTRSRYNETGLQWFKCVDGSCESGDTGLWVPVEELAIPGTRFEVNRTELINCGKWQTNLPGVDTRCFTESVDSVGSYLHIQGVTPEALGQYKLVATLASTGQVSEADAVELSEKTMTTLDKTMAVLGALAGVFVFGLLAAFLWVKFNLDVKLIVRDRFSEVENRGGRDYDAYIVYNSSSEDITGFVLEVIRPKLLESNYQVFVKDIDMNPGGFCVEDIVEAMNNSLRCILVVSDAFLSAQGQHSELQINTAIKDMADKRTKIVPILFGDVSVTALGRLLVVLRCLRYKEKKTNRSKFLKQLILRMPVRSRTPRHKDSLIENVEL